MYVNIIVDVVVAVLRHVYHAPQTPPNGSEDPVDAVMSDQGLEPFIV